MVQVPVDTMLTLVPETVQTLVVADEYVTVLVLKVVAVPETLSAPAVSERLLRALKVMFWTAPEIGAQLRPNLSAIEPV